MRARCCFPAETGPYRYTLHIDLGGSGSRLAVIMKNPSTASEERSDATIGKVEAWAARHRFGSLVVVNLFAQRATTPGALNTESYSAIMGPENDRFILAAATGADIAVAGWGNPNGIARDRYDQRIRDVLALLGALPLYLVGPLTQHGYPRHGLLWNTGCELALWQQSTCTACVPPARIVS